MFQATPVFNAAEQSVQPMCGILRGFQALSGFAFFRLPKRIPARPHAAIEPLGSPSHLERSDNMSNPKLALSLAKISASLLFLIGCSSSTVTPAPSTEIPPTHTPVSSTAIPPTSTPLVLVTTVEMVIGNWQPLSTSHAAMFLQFNSDGTCRQSFSLDSLNSVPQVECTFTFEDAKLTMTVVKLNGVPECPSPTGTYEVRLEKKDQIQLVPIEDSCGPRKSSTRGIYERIP